MSLDAASSLDLFGHASDGTPVHRVEIAAGALRAEILDWGATIRDLRLQGHGAPLVLGYQEFAPYEANPNYFGAIAGRQANRIRDGRFTIDGERFQGPQNFLGKHALHGGAVSYVHRPWKIAAQGADFVTLTLHDPDGTAGFPGALDVRLTYRILPQATLRMETEATTDAPTLCNLAQHSYFNLDNGGADDIFGHRLVLDAGAYTPVDDELIPTGRVEPVDGTRFDFRSAREIDDELFDHNFCLAPSRGPLRHAAWAQGAESGLEMEVWTTEPGIQFYSGQYIKGEAPGLLGEPYQAGAGFCLEPQTWPDSPNRPYFPQAVLRPGEIYRQTTEYRFRLP